MLKNIIDFINGLGDWNHVFIAVLLQLLVSLIGFTGWTFIITVIYFMAAFFTVWYLSKEYHEHQPSLGYIKAFFINLWSRHNRQQSIYVWSGVWLYAVIYDKFIFNFIQ